MISKPVAYDIADGLSYNIADFENYIWNNATQAWLDIRVDTTIVEAIQDVSLRL